VLFGGTFILQAPGPGRRPDLALVANDLSHWFVVEVELTSHSLEGHVLPQIRSFVYGEPQPDCAAALAARLEIPRENAETLVHLVPRTVAIVANKRDEAWVQAIRTFNAQILVVSVFDDDTTEAAAIEIDGDLQAVSESLGFGIYSAIDRSCRFRASVRLPRGDIQFVDEAGTVSTWTVVDGQGILWVTKGVGTPDIPDGAYVQVLKTHDGRLLLRRPRSSPTTPTRSRHERA
jgi:hypothetical protein